MKIIHPLLRGVVIGIANIIPGVSGGSMMVSMGVYDTLIDCITHLFSDFKRSIKTLLPYLVGMLVGIFALAGMLTWCLSDHPLPTGTAFIGLILGGLSPLMRKIDKRRVNLSAVALFLVFFVLIIALALSNPANAQGRVEVSLSSMLMLLVTGAAASATMLIPGVSGSMLLMLLGYYRPVIASVNDFQDALLGGNLALAGQQLLILIPFALGVLLGIYFLAKLIATLMRRWPTHTYCAVLGLMVASPIAILLRTDMAGATVVTILVSILTFVAGFILSAWMARSGAAVPPHKADTAPQSEPPQADAGSDPRVK